MMFKKLISIVSLLTAGMMVLTSTASAAFYRTNYENMNVRSEPSLNSSVTRMLPKGTVVEIDTTTTTNTGLTFGNISGTNEWVRLDDFCTEIPSPSKQPLPKSSSSVSKSKREENVIATAQAVKSLLQSQGGIMEYVKYQTKTSSQLYQAMLGCMKQIPINNVVVDIASAMVNATITAATLSGSVPTTFRQATSLVGSAMNDILEDAGKDYV